MSKFTQSLATNITLALTAGLLAALLISGWIIIYKVRNEIYSITDKKNQYILSLQADNAALPLWNFDSTQLQAIVDNLVKDESLYKATIKSNLGELNINAVASGQKGEDYKTFTKDIYYYDQGKPLHLGTLTVETDYSKIIRELNYFIFQLALLVVILYGVLVCAIYLISKRAIAPVTELSRTLAHASAINLPIKRSAITSRIIEVQQLFGALQKMQEDYGHYHKQLNEEKEKAEAANIAKSLFLANMSHELRTPLNSILGISKMFLCDKKLDAESMEMANILYQAGNSLLSTVNDILDIAKIEANAVILEKISLDLKAVITTAIKTIKPIASAKGLSLDCVYETDEIPLVEGDSKRLMSIFLNLITNAVKYTERGRVHISVNCIPVDSENVNMSLTVEDTGIGIPTDKMGTIFEKFSQADSSITRRYGGTGLGLFITKELIELMNGTISVKSEIGKGSIFLVNIPFKVAKEQPESDSLLKNSDVITFSHTSDEVSKLRVLVAEDHLLNQALIKKITQRMGLDEVFICDNGKLALEAYKNGHYDLILMDCHMPEMNGYEATRAIREIEKTSGRHIIIIALTADAMPGTRDQCLEAGMDEYITKPIDSDNLYRTLSRWFII